MTTQCYRVRLQLNALTDGELRPWAAARVRRHLRICPACAAEYQAIQGLDAQARAWRDVAAPAGLQAQIAHALSQSTLSSQEDTPMLHQAVLPLPTRRSLVMRFGPGLAPVGALAALAVAGALLLLPGSPVRLRPAFADVRRAMQSVGSVAWTQVETRYDGSGHLILQKTQHIWVRRAPAAIATESDASSLPQTPGGEYAGPTRTLMNAQGIVNFHVRDGVYYQHPAPDIARVVQEQIDTLTDTRRGEYGKLKQVTLNGQPTLQFQLHFHMTNVRVTPVTPGMAHSDVSGHEMTGDETLWVNTDTLRVVRKRSDIVWGPQRIIQDASGFAYNQTAPAGVFDLAPPPAARVTEDDGRGNKTVVVAQITDPSVSEGQAAPAPSDGTAFVINGLFWRTSPALPKWLRSLRPSPASDLLLTIRPVPEYHRKDIALQVGHDFLLRAPGHPDVKVTLDDWTYGRHDNDRPDAGHDFESFGLRLPPSERAKMVPDVDYALVPVGSPGAYPWIITPGVSIRLP